MRFFIAFTGMIILAWLAGWLMPWWGMAIAVFIIAFLLPQKPFTGFICGFLAVFLLWFVLASVIDFRNDHILSARMAVLIVKKDIPFVMVLLSALTGGLVAGMASLSACLLRRRQSR